MLNIRYSSFKVEYLATRGVQWVEFIPFGKLKNGDVDSKQPPEPPVDIGVSGKWVRFLVFQF